MHRWTALVALALGLVSVVDARGDDTLTAPSPAKPDPGPPHAGSHGSTVVVSAHGPVVAERNAGAVVRTDAAGSPVARLELHAGLGELIHNGQADGNGRMFVADRAADRIVEIADEESFEIGRTVAVSEPFGLALTPDGETLLTTSVSDHALVAISTHDLSVRWRVSLAAEPRGVAVANDGREAVVGFLTRGALAVVDLADPEHAVRWQSLDPRDQIVVVDDEWNEGQLVELREAPSRFRVPQGAGRRYVRNAFAVGYLGDGRVVTTYQLATPQLVHKPEVEMEDAYGGSTVDMPRVTHRLSWIDRAGAAESHHASTEVHVHQPRSFAYDAAKDTLYIGGYGDDRVVAIGGATQPSPRTLLTLRVAPKQAACGIDGLAIDGDSLRVHCELPRRLISVPIAQRPQPDEIIPGVELAPTLRTAQVERGAEIFRRADDANLSESGTLACASCHPEGRTDGLTWRLGTAVLQTPLLAGRVVGTAPYKWDGQDETLRQSLRHTIERLGGQPGRVHGRDLAALAAYVESLAAPKAPRKIDTAAVARGRTLFEDTQLGCSSCHDGAKLTDGAQYPLKSSLEQTDTPSLVGLSHSAPYYHDGSADSVLTLLTDRGSVHDMAELGGLSDPQVADLRAYLESL